jgi:hypothetical protein
MRFLLILIAALLAIPAQAQTRVFRASDVDLQQNNRLDVLEIQVGSLQKVVAEFSRPIPTPAPDPVPDAVPQKTVQPKNVHYVQIGDLKEIDGVVHRLAQVGDSVKWLPLPKPEVIPTPKPEVIPAPKSNPLPPQRVVTTTKATSSRYTTSELKAIAASYRGPMEAGVSPKSWAWEHLKNDHGFSADQVAGLSLQEALVIHSMAHGGRVKPYRSTRSQVTYTTTAPLSLPDPVTIAPPPAPAVAQRKTYAQPQGGCPNGRCPTSRSQPTYQPRFRLFGR